MAEPIRVLIVDDHAVVRQGLRAFLNLQPDIAVVGEAGGGDAAKRLSRELRPDVVLMDLVMPEGDGVAAIESLRADRPALKVLVLTSFTNEAQVIAAMRAGAAGYLLKDVEPDALAQAIRDVQGGRPALHPEVAARLMRHAAAPPAETGERFTGRELDVLRLLTEGLPNKEIGRQLYISEKTVKTHVSSILQKLGVADRTQAAVLAIRKRLV